MSDRKKWLILALLIFGMEAGAVVFTLYRLFAMQILPDRYLAAIIVILCAVLACSAGLLFSGMKQGPSIKRRVKRIFAAVLSIFMIIGSSTVTHVLGKVDAAMNTITQTEEKTVSEMDVSVRKNNPAQQITDVQERKETDIEEKPEEKSAEKPEEKSAESSISSRPFVVYISGSDTRSQILDVSRSDVNILMAVNPTTKQVLLLNTPRDYYVENPAGNGALDKLTHLGIYGIDCSMQGLEDLYDTRIDYYVQFNFNGFEKLIDAIGGITVNSDVAFKTDDGHTFVQGENQMDGKAALAFVHDRYHQASGDNARGRHQMMVIQTVVEKLTGGGTRMLLNYGSILDNLSGMMKMSLTPQDLSALVKMQLNDMAHWNIQTYAVSGKGGSDYTYSMPSMKAYVMYQDKDMVQHASELIDKVENGENLSEDDLQD